MPLVLQQLFLVHRERSGQSRISENARRMPQINGMHPIAHEHLVHTEVGDQPNALKTRCAIHRSRAPS